MKVRRLAGRKPQSPFEQRLHLTDEKNISCEANALRSTHQDDDQA